ncbi:MAG: alkane 1-monooxygenase [Maritimibacter sp.]
MVPVSEVIRFRHALPFWLSLAIVPLVILSARLGGVAMILPIAGTWWAFSALDALLGANHDNPDLDTPEAGLFWYKLITWIWLPIQIALIYGTLFYVTRSTHLAGWEMIGVMIGVGVASGTVGIVYAHELMHQSDRFERWLADLLLASVLYSHFRTEHLRVHHPWVGTRRDAVTARYNEGFHRYFWRVLREAPLSAWHAETAFLERRDLAPLDGANPFWRYWSLQVSALLLALIVGGWAGLGLFIVQAIVAIWQLELTNYVEHYGLTRKYLGDGKYEPVRPHHSWNADQKASSWLLINLQRHSDHHTKPARRFPLLQTYNEDTAPLLPYGYPIMGMAAMVPPLWRRMMNPRVRKWRADYYPEISDWGPYKRGEHPLPVVR